MIDHVVICSDLANVAGGAEKVAILSAIELAKQGIKVTFFAAIGPVEPSLLDVPDLEVVCLDQKSFYEGGSKIATFRKIIRNDHAGEQLATLLSRLNPGSTVVHFHSYLKLLSAHCIKVAKQAGFKTLLTIHDYGLACPQQSFFDDQYNQNCTKTALSIGCLCRQCTPKNYPFKVGIALRGLYNKHVVQVQEHLCGVIALSQMSLDTLRPYLNPNLPVYHVRNPMDRPKGDRIACENNDAFLWVGRFSPSKDPQLLAHAARLADARVIFVGDGENRSLIELENPDATITGWQTSDQVDTWYKSARALVMTSRWREVSPLVIAESLSRGIPVLVPDTCAGKEQVQDGIDGFVYRCGDVEALKNHLVYLMEPTSVEKMSKAAFDRYWQDPSDLPAHAKSLLLTYQKLMSSTA